MSPRKGSGLREAGGAAWSWEGVWGGGVTACWVLLGRPLTPGEGRRHLCPGAFNWPSKWCIEQESRCLIQREVKWGVVHVLGEVAIHSVLKSTTCEVGPVPKPPGPVLEQVGEIGARHGWQEGRTAQLLWHPAWRFLRILKTELAYDLLIPLLDL